MAKKPKKDKKTPAEKKAEKLSRPQAQKDKPDPKPEPALKPKPPPEPPRPKAESVKVAFTVPDAEPKKRYWIGIMPGSPLQRVAVGGEDFPNQTQRVTVDPKDGTTQRYPRPGRILGLTASKVELIKKRVVNKVVRRVGRRYDVMDKHDRGFRYDPSIDSPLPAHIFMIEVGNARGDAIREEEPQPMLAS